MITVGLYRLYLLMLFVIGLLHTGTLKMDVNSLPILKINIPIDTAPRYLII